MAPYRPYLSRATDPSSVPDNSPPSCPRSPRPPSPFQHALSEMSAHASAVRSSSFTSRSAAVTNPDFHASGRDSPSLARFISAQEKLSGILGAAPPAPPQPRPVTPTSQPRPVTPTSQPPNAALQAPTPVRPTLRLNDLSGKIREQKPRVSGVATYRLDPVHLHPKSRAGREGEGATAVTYVDVPAADLVDALEAQVRELQLHLRVQLLEEAASVTSASSSLPSVEKHGDAHHSAKSPHPLAPAMEVGRNSRGGERTRRSALFGRRGRKPASGAAVTRQSSTRSVPSGENGRGGDHGVGKRMGMLARPADRMPGNSSLSRLNGTSPVSSDGGEAEGSPFLRGGSIPPVATTSSRPLERSSRSAQGFPSVRQPSVEVNTEHAQSLELPRPRSPVLTPHPPIVHSSSPMSLPLASAPNAGGEFAVQGAGKTTAWSPLLQTPIVFQESCEPSIFNDDPPPAPDAPFLPLPRTSMVESEKSFGRLPVRPEAERVRSDVHGRSFQSLAVLERSRSARSPSSSGGWLQSARNLSSFRKGDRFQTQGASRAQSASRRRSAKSGTLGKVSGGYSGASEVRLHRGE